jgi:hypothetical protein
MSERAGQQRKEAAERRYADSFAQFEEREKPAESTDKGASS